MKGNRRIDPLGHPATTEMMIAATTETLIAATAESMTGTMTNTGEVS